MRIDRMGFVACFAVLLALLGLASPARRAAGVATRIIHPAACARNGGYVWSHLTACGWIGSHTAGYRTASCPGHRLITKAGPPRRIYHIRRAHTVISCQNISGCLSIEAQHVTVHNVKISCTSGRSGGAANGTAVIKVQDGASATIVGVTIDGRRGVHACVWHQGTALFVNKIDCAHVDDGVFSWADTDYSHSTGDHFVIENSYFHDFTERTANGHIDGYQTEGAAYGLIRHNTYLMTSDAGNESDSAIAVWDSLKSSHDITVQHNLIAGGGFAVYAEDYSPSEAHPTGGYSVRNVKFLGNVFSRHLFGCVGYWGVWYPRGRPSDSWRRAGNTVLETGAKIDHGNPTFRGRSCT